MLHLAKNLPTLFSCSEYVRDALCSLLKRDMRESFKSKGNCLVSVLAANVLYTAYQVLNIRGTLSLSPSYLYLSSKLIKQLFVCLSVCNIFFHNHLLLCHIYPSFSSTRGIQFQSFQILSCSCIQTPTERIETVKQPIQSTFVS